MRYKAHSCLLLHLRLPLGLQSQRVPFLPLWNGSSHSLRCPWELLYLRSICKPLQTSIFKSEYWNQGVLKENVHDGRKSPHKPLVIEMPVSTVASQALGLLRDCCTGNKTHWCRGMRGAHLSFRGAQWRGWVRLSS